MKNWQLLIKVGMVLGLFTCVTTLGIGFAGKDRPSSKFPNAHKQPHEDADRKPQFRHSPKNVIIMIADGCGYNHIKAADLYQCGQAGCQVYEDFPVQLAVTTYSYGGEYDPNAAWADFDCVNLNYTDSAAAATAMATGVKTYNAGLGVDINGNPVMNILERAEQLGKSTGVITSVPFSHATPAGFVIHNPDRDNYQQIADDMVNKSAAEVIMGCGHPRYNNDGKLRTNFHPDYVSQSTWTGLANGSAGADSNDDGQPDPWTLIQTRAEFQSLKTGPAPKRVFGVPQVFETLQERRSGNTDAVPFEVPFTQTVPTLDEMTLAALNVLDDDPDGFFLMIEGRAVDWAAHANLKSRLVEEMNDFNKSVEAVITWVEQNSNWGQTLLIITADHETGYITGPDSGQFAGGPVWNDLVNNGADNLPSMEFHSDTHTNSLVAFFSKGRDAQIFKDKIDGADPVRGPYIDNTDIAKVIFSLWRTADDSHSHIPHPE